MTPHMNDLPKDLYFELQVKFEAQWLATQQDEDGFQELLKQNRIEEARGLAAQRIINWTQLCLEAVEVLGLEYYKELNKVLGLWGAVIEEVQVHSCGNAIVYMGDDFAEILSELVSHTWSSLGSLVLARCPISLQLTDPITGLPVAISDSAGFQSGIDSVFGMKLGDLKLLYAHSLQQYDLKIVAHDTGTVSLVLGEMLTADSQIVGDMLLCASRQGPSYGAYTRLGFPLSIWSMTSRGSGPIT